MIKKLPLVICILLSLALFFTNRARAQKVVILQQGKPTSIRGLSVVNDKVAWLSGNKGYVAITKDAGKTWNWQQVKGFETSDFRDIEAFSDKEAVIMSSGTPALILKTTDAGANWQVKYRNRDTSIFLDAMDFDGKHGFVVADPINNHFVLFETTDKGKTWKQRDAAKTPATHNGEAAFAASGTCIRYHDNILTLVSGGSVASIMSQAKPSKPWVVQALPISQGRSSTGAFSIAKHDKKWLVTGGDYQRDNRLDSTGCYTLNAGKNWLGTKTATGFQSCIRYLDNDTFISTGTSGTNITNDNGQTWTKADGTSFNVCSKSDNGKLILLAGNNGKIGLYQPPVQKKRFGIFKIKSKP